MSLHKSSMDRPPTRTPQSADIRQSHRLYPSLPNINRYEFCLPVGSSGEKLQTAAEFRPHLLEDTQSEEVCDINMKAQILVMEEQKKELLSINKKWAKEYRTMSQYYKEEIRVLKALQHHDPSEEETSDEGEKLNTSREQLKVKTDTPTREGEVTSELLTAERETKELRLKNSTLTRRGQHQREEIQRLNKALEEALLTSQPLGGSSETLQDIWKHQADVYKEDFLRERKDREMLKDKYLELEKRFKKVRDELRVVKSQVTWTQPEHRCSCTNRAKCPNWEVRSVNQQHNQLQRCYNTDGKQ
ncbi:TNFAIP3-interacting protein 3-like [Odontesthes bonariensis]|uniref:TNFAIP3-interacting protein 3-like n=1 Tax=Odontesthes bonariensis TaxID=219752 RepID=UPI003F5880D0